MLLASELVTMRLEKLLFAKVPKAVCSASKLERKRAHQRGPLGVQGLPGLHALHALAFDWMMASTI